MNLDALLEIVKSISSVITLILGIATICGTTIPAFRGKIKAFFRPYDESIQNLEASNLSLLRNSITRIYYSNLSEHSLTPREKENVCYLFESYQLLKGNSYIHDMVEEMKSWDTKSE